LSDDFFEAATLPQAYDVVFCNFPYDEDLGEPGPDDHPCLVIDALSEDGADPQVIVICGTSQPPYWRDTYFEVPVSEGAQCGLSKDTRFNFRKVARVPWSREFFKNDDPPKALPLPQVAVRRFGFEAADYQRDHPNWKPFDV